MCGGWRASWSDAGHTTIAVAAARVFARRVRRPACVGILRDDARQSRRSRAITANCISASVSRGRWRDRLPSSGKPHAFVRQNNRGEHVAARAHIGRRHPRSSASRRERHAAPDWREPAANAPPQNPLRGDAQKPVLHPMELPASLAHVTPGTGFSTTISGRPGTPGELARPGHLPRGS